MQMTRQTPPSYSDDHGWLITPRAIASLATFVGLVYTLHAPVRYVLHLGDTVDVLSARVASLETELDQQRGTIAAAQIEIARRTPADVPAPSQSAAPSGENMNASPRRGRRHPN